MRRQRLADPLSQALCHLRPAVAVLVLFSCAINLLILASPLYMWQIYDRVLSSGRIETLVFLTLIAAVALLALGALEAVRGHILGRMAAWLERRLTPALIGACLWKSVRGEASSSQGLRDLALIRNVIAGPGISALLDAPWAPVFITIIALMHPILGLVALCAAVLLLALAVVNEAASRHLLAEAGRDAVRATQRADALIREADLIEAMGMRPACVDRWSKANEKVLALQLKAGDRSATIIGLSKFLRLFVQVLILGVGAWLVVKSELTPGGMIAASILLSRGLSPIEQSIGAWKILITGRDARDRLTALFSRMPAEKQGMALPAPRGRLACENVTFLPPNRAEPVLRGVSFALEAGTGLGIIGPSAAGKSTLCRMLIGILQPTRGAIRLDGAELKSWGSDRLGPHIGYLPQDVILFDGTISENIARLATSPDPATVVAAARVAGVHQMILDLPDGYDTRVGPGAGTLSGGQRQRIGLARALYGEPCLIVLDEPSASLDADGEAALLNAMVKAKAWGATVIVVAHQPRILAPVDQVLVLRHGVVESFGSRDDVLKTVRPLRPLETPRRQVLDEAASEQKSMESRR